MTIAGRRQPGRGVGADRSVFNGSPVAGSLRRGVGATIPALVLWNRGRGVALFWNDGIRTSVNGNTAASRAYSRYWLVSDLFPTIADTQYMHAQRCIENAPPADVFYLASGACFASRSLEAILLA